MKSRESIFDDVEELDRLVGYLKEKWSDQIDDDNESVIDITIRLLDSLIICLNQLNI